MAKIINNLENEKAFVFPEMEIIDYEKSGLNADTTVTSSFDAGEDIPVAQNTQKW